MPKAKRGKSGRFMKVTRSAGRSTRRAAGRAYSRARGYARRTRGTSLGLVGKTGVGIMGGAPLVGSGLDAAETAIALMRQNQIGLISTAKYTFWRFINGVSVGFGGGQVMNNVLLYKQDGSAMTVSAQSAVPPGSWFKTTVAGGILVAFDIGISWASRKVAKVNSGVRFLGQKLTGGK